nr:MAG TPA: hypothetical protein [Caudoviricetes sp.]
MRAEEQNAFRGTKALIISFLFFRRVFCAARRYAPKPA